jgi:hypothetical protein
MTRLGHFIEGNRLPFADVAEWAVMPESRLRRLAAGKTDIRLHDLYHLAGACSYLLGRRVKITELVEDTDEERS